MDAQKDGLTKVRTEERTEPCIYGRMDGGFTRRHGGREKLTGSHSCGCEHPFKSTTIYSALTRSPTESFLVSHG
ncbi:hypothetical protein Hamer_G015449 [Homarus americanus]|uniref:Uncharacterized protein n=1 Tax=Homarus americanus TaxID=6706 RepID=A0A8J5NCD4_HOMAM|nr:hypothetical protein Hamer_G015449 [Homarus americanus]